MGQQEYTVRRATSLDGETVYAIICDAAQWLLNRGIEQWKWAMTEGGRSFINARIETKETYILLDDQDRPVSTFTIQWEDAEIWGNRLGRDGLAGYVHGLAVRREFGGQGLGAKMIEVAEQMARSRGAKCLRLDCLSTNARLCEYYRTQGFADLGVSPEPLNWSPRLFERAIGGADCGGNGEAPKSIE